jgi:hypothetical protein
MSNCLFQNEICKILLLYISTLLRNLSHNAQVKESYFHYNNDMDFPCFFICHSNQVISTSESV